VWIVDGPIIRFGLPWAQAPFSTRMTVIRSGRELFIHSPTLLTTALKAEIGRLGTPRWIIAPNRLHYWWIPDWNAAFPDATVYLAPRVKEQAADHIAFDGLGLETDGGYPWDAEIATLPIVGRYMTEVEFFHRVSRTLVLTDLIENFEPEKLASRSMRWLTWLGGVQDPHGQTPRDMRFTFPKRQLRVAVETMIAWAPDRIVLAHGRWHERDGTTELRRAFRWLLD
jgi:hypothetical protein